MVYRYFPFLISFFLHCSGGPIVPFVFFVLPFLSIMFNCCPYKEYAGKILVQKKKEYEGEITITKIQGLTNSKKNTLSS